MKMQNKTDSTPLELYKSIVKNTFHPGILYYAIDNWFKDVLARDAVLGNHIGLGWPGAYAAEAALVAFINTKQKRFLDLFVNYYDTVLERRDDKTGRFDEFHNKTMNAWGGWSTDLDITEWVAAVTPNARIVYGGTKLARIVRNNPYLKGKYGAAAARYLSVAKTTMDAFEVDWKSIPNYKGVKWYVSPYRWSIEATNHVHQAGTVWLNLAALTNNVKYKQRVQYTIDVFLKGLKKGPNGTLYWNYFPYFAKKEKKEYANGREFSERVWKASLTAPFLLRAKAQGFKIPDYVVPALAKTFTTLTFQERNLLSNLSPIKSSFFDPIVDQRLLSMAQNSVTLIEFQSVEPALATRIATLIGNRPDLFPRAWASGTHGLLAYAYMLAHS